MAILDGGLTGLMSDPDRLIDGSPNRNGRSTKQKVRHFEQVNTDLTAGERTTALRRRITWGNEERWGSGMADVPRTVGTAFVELIDASGNAILDGDLYLVKNGENKRSPEIAWDGDLGELACESITDPTKEDHEAIPERANVETATPEQYLEVHVETESAVTVDWDASTVKLPATIYD